MMRSPLPRRRPLPHPVLQLLPGLLLAVGAGCSDDTPAPTDPDGDTGIVDVPGSGGTDGSDGTGGGSGSGAGGSSGMSGSVPVIRDAVTLGDDALARQALALLGASAVNGNGVCKNCHSLGRPTISRWSQLTQTFKAACLSKPDLADQAAVDAMLACFRTQAGGDGSFAPESFGIYAAAAKLPWFSYLFQHASGINNRQREQDSFVQQVGMPRSGTPWTQAEFDIVAEWFERKVPKLLDLVPADSGEICEPGLDAAALGTHVQAMATAGWRARNAQLPLLNFGCTDGQTGSACLGGFPLASSEWEALGGAKIRLLYDNSDSLSTYWSRVSADGRYIASGLRNPDDDGHNGQILDLSQSPVKVIPGKFRYDATFFPDNSGFVVQQGGGPDSGGSDTEPSDGTVAAGETALTCNQSVLASDPTELTGDETQCKEITGRLGLYQQLAASLDGSDYWVIHGSYTSDNGGLDNPVLNNPSAAYEANSTITLTPLANLGNGYEAQPSVRVPTPRQGDPMLSPSGNLLVTRIKGAELNIDEDLIAAEQAGYALYKLNKTQSGGNWSASLQDLGRICVQGGKPTFSFDERWMVFHRYVVAQDATELGFPNASAAGFGDYLERGSSNLYLVDLSSGAMHRLTNMPPGQFALFPHFRSDGWIYFVVRTLAKNEYFVATDAALLIEGQ
jgi:hypothetical protein